MLKQWFNIIFLIVKKSVLIKEMGWIFIFQGLCIFGPLNPGVWLQHICFLHKLHNFPCIFLDVVSKMWFRIWSTSPSDFVCVAKWSLRVMLKCLSQPKIERQIFVLRKKNIVLFWRGQNLLHILWQNWWNSFQTQLVTSVQLF